MHWSYSRFWWQRNKDYNHISQFIRSWASTKGNFLGKDKRRNIFCCLWLWLWITIVQLVDDASLNLFWYENVKDVSIFVIDDIAIFGATKSIWRLPFSQYNWGNIIRIISMIWFFLLIRVIPIHFKCRMNNLVLIFINNPSNCWMGDDACSLKKILTSLTKQETIESTTTTTNIKYEFSQIVFEGGQSNAPLLL